MRRQSGNSAGGGGRAAYARAALANGLGLAASDALTILGGLVLGKLLVFGTVSMQYSLLMIPAWIAATVPLRLNPGWGGELAEEVRRLEVLLFLLFGSAALAVFLSRMGTSSSRGTFVVAYAFSALVMPFGRVAVRQLFVRCGRWGVPAVIYGQDDTVPRLAEALRHDAHLGFRPVGIFSDEAAPGATIGGLPVLGGLRDTSADAPVALLAAPGLPRHTLVELIEGPLRIYRKVILIPDLVDAPSLWVRPCDIRGILGLEITQNLLYPSARLLKRALDVGLVLVSIPLWAPLFALVALLVWLADFRAPLYRQQRIGRCGRPFFALKFRTMVADAEAVLEDALRNDPQLRQEWQGAFKLRDDPRITPLGRFLRRASLDEIPQFLNVLRGEMSLVGPRPLPPYHATRLSERARALREQVRPGLTGLWQVSGRSENGIEGMEQWDAYYVRNWSVWLDLVILVRTTAAVLRGRGAY